MTHFRTLADIRREFGELRLDESSIQADPIVQFKLWFEEILKCEIHDPTAMVLSTVDEFHQPDSRVVLLKGVEQGGFVFYTNYLSNKSKQIETTPYVALNFFWAQMARQIRIRGPVEKVSASESDSYFSSRPMKSQLSAIASPQSKEISSRQFLESALNTLIEQHGQAPVLRPEFWGGYRVKPENVEFWQGRDNRLHDRIQYYLDQGQWSYRRLAP